MFKPRTLVNGLFDCKEQVEYIDISNKTLKLNSKLYVYNPISEVMEEEDIAETEILTVDVSGIMRIDKNTYVRKNIFDCSKEEDQQSSSYQPIQGLTTDTTYQTLKTHNFNDCREEPEHEDLIYYQNRFWVVEEVRKTYTYTPKERTTLHLSIKAIGR